MDAILIYKAETCVQAKRHNDTCLIWVIQDTLQISLYYNHPIAIAGLPLSSI